MSKATEVIDLVTTAAIDLGNLISGLRFLSSKKTSTEDGIRYLPTERALHPDDVLDWVDRGEDVVIVAADGRKHVVVKEAGNTAAPAETTKGKTNGVLSRDIPGGGKQK